MAPDDRNDVSVLREDPKTGIRNVCIHKGLFAPTIEEKFPRLRLRDVNDIGRAPRTGPVDFLVYHSGYRWVVVTRQNEWGVRQHLRALGQRPGRDSGKYGVTTVYRSWAIVCLDKRGGASVVGGVDGDTDQGLGVDRSCGHRRGMGTGAPQWHRGLAATEIPEDMQKKYGFIHWARRDGPVKTAVLSGTQRRLYGLEKHAEVVTQDGSPR